MRSAAVGDQEEEWRSGSSCQRQLQYPWPPGADRRQPAGIAAEVRFLLGAGCPWGGPLYSARYIRPAARSGASTSAAFGARAVAEDTGSSLNFRKERKMPSPATTSMGCAVRMLPPGVMDAHSLRRPAPQIQVHRQPWTAISLSNKKDPQSPGELASPVR